MREVDFRYLQSALQSLSSSTDLMLERGRVRAVLSRQASPYASHRGVRFELVHEPLEEHCLLVANRRKILLVARAEDDVWRAAEAIGRDGRPYPGETIGWDGPWADWVVEAVPGRMPRLRVLVHLAHDYGLIEDDWLGAPLVYAAWLVPVVMNWDERGRPVFLGSERPAEPEPDPVDSDLPVEI